MFDETPVGDLNVRWWLTEDAEERFQQLLAAFRALEDRDRGRQDANEHHMRLYGNMPVEDLMPSVAATGVSEPRVTLNVIANVCDYVHNRIGKLQPMPRPLPVAGNFSIRRRAKLLERFFEAQFRISRVFEQLRRAFLDAAVIGTGILKIYGVAGQIKVERVFPSEIIVDHHEARYGEPRTMYQRKWVSRDVLREAFVRGTQEERERLEEIVDTAGRQMEHDTGDYGHGMDEGVHDQVLVVEAWHLPSGPNATDGFHTIVVDSGELMSEKYEDDYFPFVFLRWKQRLQGFWGVGLAEELNGIQVEINRMLIKIQAAYQLMARPLILIEAGSKIVKSHLTNEIGSVVNYVGQPPVVWTPPTFHPEFYQHLERLYQKAFEIAGMSQGAVAPTFNAGESGVARQYSYDIETDRFSTVVQSLEQAVLDLSRQMIDRAKELAAEGKFETVAKRDKGSIESIDWEEVDMAKDQYQLTILPQSAFPSLPGARIDRVLTLYQAGLFDSAEALRLMDMPDLEDSMDLARAASDDIDRIIEGILDDGVFEPPEPYMDLNLALKKVQDAYNRAKRDGAEERALADLQKFMLQTHLLQQKAEIEQMKVAQMAAVPGSEGALPPGPGAPPATGTQGAPPTAATPQQ